MKITDIHIDGFGIFHDQSISGMDKDLVLFYGHNEAGKSTLLSFIRSVFFGFPRANSKDPSYPPVAGGVHGGRIDIRTNSGDEWSVSRKPGVNGGTITVSGRDGTTYDKTMLSQLLGGIPYEAFRNIMAFGLTELQSFDTLSGEHIASAIYGAGLGTSMMAMPRARKTINDRMARLFLKNGSKPVLNQLVSELEKVRRKRHDASLQSDQYNTTCDAKAQVEKAVQSLRNKLSRRRHEQRQYEALERLWPDWITLKENLRELAALGETAATTAFPEDGLRTIDRLSEIRARAQTTLSELNARKGRIAARIAALPVDDNALAQAGAIGFLVENRSAYIENIQKLPLLIQEKQHQNNTIRRLIQRLGNRWNETMVLSFDRSFFTRETIRKHQTALEALARDLATTEALLADRQSRFHQAGEVRRPAKKKRVEKGALPPEWNPYLVEKLKQGRDRFADNLAELSRVSDMMREAEESLSHLQRAALEGSPGTKWPVAVIGVAGLIAACFMAYFGSYRDAAFLMGGSLVAAWATWVYRAQQRQTRQYRQSQVDRQNLYIAKLQTICAKISSERTAWERKCNRLGFSNVLSPLTALEALDTIEQTVKTVSTRDRCAEELTRIEEEINIFRQKSGQTLDAMEWPEISNDVLPRTVTELATLLEESKLNKREKETLGRELSDIEKELAAIGETLRETESDIRNLLESAKTPDETTFRKFGEMKRKQKTLLSAANAAVRNMRRISGELDATRLKSRLESLSLTEIRTRKEAAGESIRELDLELSTLYTRRAELKQTLETLATSDDIIRFRAEEAKLLADIETGALEWSRYALANHLITRAREVFEKKHQPRILRDAGTVFSQMTGGKFRGVVAPLGENTLSAVKKNGDRFPPDHLSRGTAEQLYLAVRFSYIRHQARNGELLPVIMDDILVNFDPARARKAAEAIMRLSASHQVLFFTCHPETTAIFQDIDPEIPMYRLNAGHITAPEKHPHQEKN